MLTFTREAARAIRQLMAEENVDGVRMHAGTRRFARAGAPSIQVEVAQAPDADDTVLEAGGARLYLDPDTLRTLDDKVLDAESSSDHVRFVIFQAADRTRA